jgi:hypothetical protein
VLPIVEEMPEFNKEKQENRIQTAIAAITPAVSLNKQVEMAYLPIADNPRAHP